MADVEEEILLQANLFLLLVLRRRHHQLQNRRKNRFRVQKIFLKRQELGAFHILVKELCVSDKDQKHVNFFLISRHVSFVIQRIMSCKRGQATVKVCRKCVKLSLITFGEWNYGGLENFPHLVLVFLLPHWGMQSSGFCFCNVMKSLDIEYQRTFPQ